MTNREKMRQMEELTPSQIVQELDRYIVGQADAKRAVAVALRNRYRRRMLSTDLREEVIPKNILMIGPTGVGKTEIARRLAKLANAPFVKVEATKYTEVGYVGRDVESMVRDLVQVAYRMVENEKLEEMQEQARELADRRIVDVMQPLRSQDGDDRSQPIRSLFGQIFGQTGEDPGTSYSSTTPPASQTEEERRQIEREMRIRSRLFDQIRKGLRDEEMIDIEVEEGRSPVMQVFSPQGMEEMGMDMQNLLGNMLPKRKKVRSMKIKEARELLTQEEARNLVDADAVVREAVERTEQSGIIFVDELDKIAGREGGAGPDVSREGVQRDILPIIEGSTVATKYGSVRTNHILFIAAGAFHVSKPSDLIPELQGRLPIRVELESLNEADFKRILTEPQNALTRQYAELLATEGVTIEFTPEGIERLSAVAAQINQQSENIGARRLHTVLERVLEDISFNAPYGEAKKFIIDVAYIEARLKDVLQDQDLSRYIL